MRTAEEIIKWAFDNTPDNSMISDVYIVAVNEARKEAIEESIKAVNLEWVDDGYVHKSKGYAKIDYKQILNLIEQLK